MKRSEGDKNYLIAPEGSDMLLQTNRCRAPKDLLFFDQSNKSPDSGLQANDAKSKWIRRPFPLVSQTKAKIRAVSDRRLERNSQWSVIDKLSHLS